MKNRWMGVLAVAALPAAVSLAAGSFSIVEIPGEASSVANDGTVILSYGAVWTSTNGVQVIGVAPTSISTHGNIAGSILLAEGSSTRTAAVTWQNGQTTQLGAFQTGLGVEEGALGINNLGKVVGYSYAGPSGLRAIRWSGGVAEDLGIFLPENANGSVARGINDAGQVIVTANAGSALYGAADDRSYLLDGSVLTPITTGDPTAVGVHARAINAGGQITGSVSFEGGISQAFIWSGGQMLMASDFSGEAGSTDGLAINEQGIVVGAFSPLDHSPSIAFMWDGVNSPINLNSLIDPQSGWYLYAALGMNDSGEIVGNGLLNGVPTGFLLTPIASPSGTTPSPEPATVATLVLAAPLLLRRRRRSV